MLNVSATKFEALEAALLECAADVRNERGLKVVTPKTDDQQVMNAASIALMVLIGTWVKPENVAFIDYGDKIK